MQPPVLQDLMSSPLTAGPWFGQGFERVTILRPGVLQKKDSAPMGGLLPSIKVADVARAMVADAERPAQQSTAVLEMGAIQALARARSAKGA